MQFERHTYEWTLFNNNMLSSVIEDNLDIIYNDIHLTHWQTIDIMVWSAAFEWYPIRSDKTGKDKVLSAFWPWERPPTVDTGEEMVVDVCNT